LSEQLPWRLFRAAPQFFCGRRGDRRYSVASGNRSRIKSGL